jgi:hypothetical protein
VAEEIRLSKDEEKALDRANDWAGTQKWVRTESEEKFFAAAKLHREKSSAKEPPIVFEEPQ